MKDKFDLDAETICDYHVSSNRKKLWACEIELLDALERTCKKNNITYFVLWGSAIGAVRHGGFIPWDDDIDIGMVREDFEVLRKCDKSEFADCVDFQYGVSDHGVDMIMRIRDARTTGIVFDEVNSKGNKGAFIEIYPFDYVKNNKRRLRQAKLNLHIYNCINTKVKHIQRKGLKKAVFGIINALFTPEKLWSLFERISKLQNNGSHEFIDSPAVPSPYTLKGQHLFRTEDCVNTISMPFEYTTIRVPEGYDRVISAGFKNYMTLPPVEERGTHHKSIVFYDPNRPYTEYEDSDLIIRYFSGDDSLELL
ncbi:MAG: LicD family protein [Oscillospiraceae bacterium]|nr:LicD family protein [Oscillospiraceae bacterium]